MVMTSKRLLRYCFCCSNWAEYNYCMEWPQSKLASRERKHRQWLRQMSPVDAKHKRQTTRDAAASRDRFLWFASATSSGVRYKANDQQARREYALLCPVVSVEEMRGTSVVLAMQIACALHRNIASTLMSVTSKCWRNIKNKQISIYFWIVVFPNKGKWNLKKRD